MISFKGQTPALDVPFMERIFSYMVRDVIDLVAGNVRALRTARGLSAAELAAASGVGKATLSRVEAGQANPTVETLYALADALGVPFGALTSPPPATVQLVRAAAAPRIGGAVEARVVDRLHSPPLVEVLDVVFPPGRVRESRPHPAAVIERLLLVRGRLRAGPVGETVELAAGDLLRFPGDVPHLYSALGRSAAQAVVLMVYPRAIALVEHRPEATGDVL
jgi:XRE family transcriptional regulator, regulator of sulfur utilization